MNKMVASSNYFHFCTAVLFVVVLARMTAAKYEASDWYRLFEKFTYRYKRDYVTNETEYEHRFKIFKKNVKQSDILNKNHFNISQPVYGITKFSDLSPDEFKAVYLSSYTPKFFKTQNSSISRSLSFSSQKLGIPDKVDWRSKGVLTAIKNQKTCGACWAFSVVETMESMRSIQYNTSAEDLSVQEMIDCDDVEKGCEGGDICRAAEWATDDGVVKESYYPLTDHTDKCKTVSESLPRVKVQHHTCLQFIGNEKALLAEIVDGPVAVAVDATTWHSYVSGIIRYHCSANINHAVSVVGYDLTGDVPYYIVRNSWGSDFGDEGFLYIKIGENLCGIATEVTSMTVTNFE